MKGKVFLSNILIIMVVFLVSAFIGGCTTGSGNNYPVPSPAPVVSPTPSPSPSFSPSPSPTPSPSPSFSPSPSPSPTPSPSPSPSPSPTPPEVITSTPSSGAVNVEPDVSATITFSKDMDPSTINGTNVILNTVFGQVAGAVTYDAGTRTATFTPSTRLALLLQHTIQVTTGVKDAEGNPLDALFSTSFTIRDGAWSYSPQLLENGTNDSYLRNIAFDASGNAMAIWTEKDGIRDNVMCRRYIVGSGWQPPEPVETSNNDAQAQRVAVDPAGNAVFVWLQDNSGVDDLWARRYVPGVGWDPPELIDAGSGDVKNATVGVDPSGNAFAVWRQDDGSGRINLYSRRYVAGAGWEPGVQILDILDTDVWDYFGLAVDPAGNAIVVWVQNDSANDSVFSNYYIVGTGWGSPEPVGSTGNAYLFFFNSVAIDPSGNAIAVWDQGNDIWANRYVPGTGWENPAQEIDTGSGTALGANVAADAMGNFIAVWCQDSTPSGHYSPYACHYNNGSGWGPPIPLDPADTDDAFITLVSADSAGNAIALWMKTDGVTDDIKVCRYVAESGWNPAQLLESDVYSIWGLNYGLFIAPQGHGFATWTKNTGIEDVWVDIFE